MTIYVVSLVVPAQYEPDSDDPLVFIFDVESEAEQFVLHVNDLYGIETGMVASSIDTYDSAIEALVEAIGPSED